MSKRKKVIHVETGKVFSSAAAAEREFNLPESVLSEAIRLGRKCHGHLFKFYDEGVEYAEEHVEPVLPNKKNVDILNVVVDPCAPCHPTDKEAASEYFNSLGYDTEVIDGVVLFHRIGEEVLTYEAIKEVVKSSGYDASWGIGPHRSSSTSSRYAKVV